MPAATSDRVAVRAAARLSVCENEPESAAVEQLREMRSRVAVGGVPLVARLVRAVQRGALRDDGGRRRDNDDYSGSSSCGEAERLAIIECQTFCNELQV